MVVCVVSAVKCKTHTFVQINFGATTSNTHVSRSQQKKTATTIANYQLFTVQANNVCSSNNKTSLPSFLQSAIEQVLDIPLLYLHKTSKCNNYR